MSFVMAYYLVTLVVILIAHATIFPVNGQCTVQGCDNEDPLISIFAEIQQLRLDLFDQLSKQVQSNNELFNASFQELKSQLDTLNMSCQAVDRCPLEQNIFREQFQSMHEVFNESFQEMKSQHDAIVTSLQAMDRRLEEHDISIRNQTQNSRTFANGSCDPAADVCDCSDIRASGQNRSGVYEVCVGLQLNPTCTSAFCDMETDNLASLVFQRRKDGSVNFNRTWAEYREGFGNPDGEFWLGNEMIYLLTSKQNYKLRVDLEGWEGEKRFAEYSTFSIKSSADNYRLTLGRYSGDAVDSMNYNNGMQFSTIDADNDNAGGSRHCAREFGGGWWYGSCSYAYLNDKYHQRYDRGIIWHNWKNSKTHLLKATEMKLVPVA